MNVRMLSAATAFAVAAVIGGCGCSTEDKKPVIHAHRGGAALFPENTIVAMLGAVEMCVPVLELDLHMTRDSVVVVSHDAVLPALRTLTEDGDALAEGDSLSYSIYSMDYDSLSRFDVGSLADPRWPRRENIRCCVPRLSDLVDTVEQMTATLGLHPVGYNVEIKSDPSKDHIYTPDYRTFADECMRVLLSKDLGYRLIIQCFDVRTLNYLRGKYPTLCLSYLVEDTGLSFDEQLALLDFVPQYYSPESGMLTREVVDRAHEMGMKVLPWTVDTEQEALRLRELGVDAIITDCPDSMAVWLDRCD